jgi:hypothetical protein
MSRHRFLRAVQVVIVVASLAGNRAVRADVALGASLGYSHLRYSYSHDPGHPTADVVGITGAEEWHQPGMRVGYVTPGGNWDVNADVGFTHRSEFGYHETVFEAMPQLQLNAPGRGGLSPFVNGGLGIEYETAFISWDDKVNATRSVIGAGVGMRKSVSDGHGLVRIEFRYDHLFEVDKTNTFGTTTFPGTDLFSVKLGFDLLIAKANKP